MNPLALIPARIRTIVYAVGLLGWILLAAASHGYSAIHHPDPTWLVFVNGAWSYVAGPAGVLLAIGNVRVGMSKPLPAQLGKVELDGGEIVTAVRRWQREHGQKPTV